MYRKTQTGSGPHPTLMPVRFGELTDMHIHVLPGLDDGSRTMEETVDTLREAVRQGIRRMIVTPHFHPERYVVTAEQIRISLKEVRQVCQAEVIPLELHAGQECLYYSGLVRELDQGNALTLAGSRYVLVEFSPDSPFSAINHGLRDLRESGYEPILAHFERYETLRDEEHLIRLKDQHYLMQMNFDTLLKKDGFFRKNPWRRLLREGYVDFLGSDCHGTHFRPLHVEEAVLWLRETVEPILIQRILTDHPACILKDRAI